MKCLLMQCYKVFCMKIVNPTLSKLLSLDLTIKFSETPQIKRQVKWHHTQKNQVNLGNGKSYLKTVLNSSDRQYPRRKNMGSIQPNDAMKTQIRFWLKKKKKNKFTNHILGQLGKFVDILDFRNGMVYY